MFVGLFHMLCSKTHVSIIQYPGVHPPISMEAVPHNLVLFLWLLKAEGSTWFIYRKETFQRGLTVEGTWPIFIG